MKQERLAILQEIDRLDAFRCDKCIVFDLNNVSIHCECLTASAIRKLGERLMSLTNARKDITGECYENVYDHEITVDGYKELKSRGMSDAMIAKKYEKSKNDIQRWKKASGLETMVFKKRVAVGMPLGELTAERYKELIAKGHVNNAIVKDYKLAISSFYRWKKMNGL